MSKRHYKRTAFHRQCIKDGVARSDRAVAVRERTIRIRDLYASGMSTRAIGALLGIDYARRERCLRVVVEREASFH